MSTDHPPDPPEDVHPLDAGPEAGSAYEPPAELDEGQPASARKRAPPRDPGDRREPGDEDGADEEPLPRLKRPIALQVGIALAVLAVVVASLLGYRSYKRSQALAEGLPKAEALLRLDTAAGYRAAADLLQPLAQIDSMQAASMRAFAMAMLAADYRDAEAEPAVEALLVEPGRADQVPPFANLATSALYLGRRSVAEATTYAGRAGQSPWSGTLQGRIALQAGNPEAGAGPVGAAVQAAPGMAAAQAIQGDLARRLRKDPVAARSAYTAALAASALHPRAAYGLAKLALASQIPLADAMGPLQRLLADDPATPAPERARAALHLAALQLRAGDRAASRATLDRVGDAASRGWAEQAAGVMAADAKGYRAVLGAPPAYQSASDDDPPQASPAPPPVARADAPARKPAKKVAPPPAKKAAGAKRAAGGAKKPAGAKPAP